MKKNLMIDISIFIIPTNFWKLKFYFPSLKENFNIYISESFFYLLDKSLYKIISVLKYLYGEYIFKYIPIKKLYMNYYYFNEIEKYFNDIKKFLKSEKDINFFSYKEFKDDLNLKKIPTLEKTTKEIEIIRVAENIILDELVFLLEKSILISQWKKIFNKFKKYGVYLIELDNIFKNVYNNIADFENLKKLKKVAKYIAIGIECLSIPIMNNILSDYNCLREEIMFILEITSSINIFRKNKFLYFLIDP